MKKGFFWLAQLALVLTLFFYALGSARNSAAEQGRLHLETALRQAAVTCYASEGIYPPALSYLEEHYGVQIDRQQYVVYYEVFADNLMPDITVLERAR